MNFFSKKKNQFISEVVILSALFGFAAGLVGEIVADVYIEPWRELNINQNLNTNQNISLPSIPELKRVKKFLGVQQDFEVDKSVRQIQPALVGIYLKKPSGQDPLSQIYLPKDFKGNAFILTSDGWLITQQSVVALKKEQLVAVYNNTVFSLEKVIKDPMSGTVFIKITADNLPVVTLGDSDEIVLGQLVIALNYLGEAAVTNIKETDFQQKETAKNLILSTESFSQSIILQDLINSSYLGSPLINLGGEVVGVIKAISEKGVVSVIPLNQFRLIILGVLKDNSIKRPYLGINYLDLTQVTGLEQNLTQGLKRGALVFASPLRNTPAAEAGIKINDIILTVDDQPVDKDNNLTKLIQQYQPKDQLDLEIMRNGKIIIKKVTLSVLPQ